VSFRNERKKFSVSADEVNKRIEEFAAEMKQKMYESALERMKTFIKYFNDYAKLVKWVGRGVGLIHLCTSEECGEQIEEGAKGSVLGKLEEIPDWVDEEPEGNCIICGKKGYLAAVGKAY
jgi:prolyl-tRNA synthetase